jgi:hypothetical protein
MREFARPGQPAEQARFLSWQLQALADLAGADSPGILQVTGSTDALPWIAVGTYDVSVNSLFPVWIRGAFGIPAR